MKAGPAGTLLGVLALVGCNGTVTRVPFDESQLVGRQQRSVASCPMRLKDVIDGRAAPNQSGGLGWNQMVLEDAPRLVRDQLLKAGLQPADATQGRDVVVTLKHMYMGQNQMTKNPVVVYEVVIGDDAAFIVRAQPTIMNWNSSKRETVSAFSSALHQANDKLLMALNQRCAKT